MTSTERSRAAKKDGLVCEVERTADPDSQEIEGKLRPRGRKRKILSSLSNEEGAA